MNRGCRTTIRDILLSRKATLFAIHGLGYLADMYDDSERQRQAPSQSWPLLFERSVTSSATCGLLYHRALHIQVSNAGQRQTVSSLVGWQWERKKKQSKRS